MPGVEADATKGFKAATDGRKIIYNAHIDLVTENLSTLETKLAQLVQTSKSYIADSDVSGTAGVQRSATWKIRVPVDAYDGFIKAATSLGELVSLKANSQDVTEEFFDVQARESAKKIEETRLLKHLTDSTGKLEDILLIERELSRVRSEIERLHGRLQALANLTSLTTVTLIVREIKNYVPPQAPTLLTRAKRVFSDSVAGLLTVGEALLLGFIAFVPWLPFIAIALLLVRVSLRRHRRVAAAPNQTRTSS